VSILWVPRTVTRRPTRAFVIAQVRRPPASPISMIGRCDPPTRRGCLPLAGSTWPGPVRATWPSLARPHNMRVPRPPLSG
jgi:hypothetical protein